MTQHERAYKYGTQLAQDISLDHTLFDRIAFGARPPCVKAHPQAVAEGIVSTTGGNVKQCEQVIQRAVQQW